MSEGRKRGRPRETEQKERFCFTVRLSEEDRKRLQRIQDVRGQSKAAFFRRAIRRAYEKIVTKG